MCTTRPRRNARLSPVQQLTAGRGERRMVTYLTMATDEAREDGCDKDSPGEYGNGQDNPGRLHLDGEV